MLSALQAFSLSFFSPFQTLPWQTASSFESRYFMCTCVKERIFLINPFSFGFYIVLHVGFLVVLGGAGVYFCFFPGVTPQIELLRLIVCRWSSLFRLLGNIP